MATQSQDTAGIGAEPATAVSYPEYAAAFAEHFRGQNFNQADINRGFERYQSTRRAAR